MGGVAGARPFHDAFVRAREGSYRADSVGRVMSSRRTITTLMRIVYLADTQIPSRASNGMQIMRMCAAFAAEGADLTLVHPRRFGNRPEGYAGDVWAFYGVPENFRMITLPTPLTRPLSNVRWFARVARGVPLSTWIFRRSRPRAEPFVTYSRSMLGAWLAIRARRFWGSRSACRGVYVEVHDAPPTGQAWNTLSSADGLVAISAALRDYLASRCPTLAYRTFVEHDGVDGALLRRPTHEAESVRRRLGIDEHSTIVGYTGRINGDKGLNTVLGAAELLHAAPVHFVLVGKVYDDLDVDGARRLANVSLIGFVPPVDVPSYVAACDMLVMPTSAKLSYSRFTSPLKLFEYLASGKPVICSDLPVLREIVQHERNALLYQADDAASLADAVQRLRTDDALRVALAEQATRDVVRFCWESRARRILELIGENSAALNQSA
jgi:glycosyltransferase involved in cell wall biosynthesis